MAPQEYPPTHCAHCGAGRSIHGGHGGQINRHGWYSYECGMRWHENLGWCGRWQAPKCQARELANELFRLCTTAGVVLQARRYRKNDYQALEEAVQRAREVVKECQ